MDGQNPDQNSTGQFKPGDTIRPQQMPGSPLATAEAPVQSSLPPEQAAATQSTQANPAQAPAARPELAPAQPAPAQQLDTSFDIPAEDNNFSAQFEPSVQTAADSLSQDQSVSWTASEYVAHHKSAGWYALLLMGTLAIAVVVWLATKDVVSVAVIIVVGAVLATYASRQPRQLSYQLSHRGLIIGQRQYNLHNFRSFSIVPEGAFTSIVFSPLKRFGVATTIYYDPKDEEAILNILTTELPHEEKAPDAIDGFLKRIRF